MTDYNLGGYLLVQSAMFFLNYGLGYFMPWWVVWFPTIAMIPGSIFFLLLFSIIKSVVSK